MVAAFGTAPTTEEVASFQRTVVEPLTFDPITHVDFPAEVFVREERIKQGDTVAGLLSKLGIREPEAIDYLRASSGAQALSRQLSPGKTVTARVSATGELQRLIFPLNGGKDMALTIDRTSTGFEAHERALVLDTKILMKSAEVKYSLFGAADAAGIPDAVAMQLADIFGGDIDFHRDLRKGDRFAVVFESIQHMGKPVRIGQILAAEFVNNGKAHRAVWFQGTDGHGGYYSIDGKNIRKAFLRSPLEFSRVTSGFTSARFHPVLQQWRAHKGTDYGAPVGTRVRATGDGIVEFVGSKGGYGKVIVLRHQSRFTTLYGHLSGFAAGVRKGARVAQGDVIGFVGATGLASGPHLHYEFRIDDVHQNPLAVSLPSAPPLAVRDLARFRETAAAQMVRIDLIGSSNLALLD